MQKAAADHFCGAISRNCALFVVRLTDDQLKEEPKKLTFIVINTRAISTEFFAT